MKIGVVGYSSNNIDAALASRLLYQSFQKLITPSLLPEEIEIVTGLTNIGVPRLAYLLADNTGYVKIGISAEQAYKVNCGVYAVDKVFIEGSRFGDESGFFINYIDYLVRVGGGKQSKSEVALFKAKCANNGWQVNERLVENELPLLST